MALLAFGASLVLGFLLIPLLKRLRFGQNILSYVKEHAGKSGTPTFGGLIFLPASILVCLPFLDGVGRDFWVAVSIGFSYMVVGIMDDALKKIHRENKGLTGWQKLFFQTVVAVFAGLYCMKSGASRMELPFMGRSIEFGFWTLPVSVFVFLATVNAVNLTDGLDGLAAGTSAPFFFTLGCLVLPVAGGGLSMLCFALVGGLSAYLVFNTHRATVFMGDTGSLGLGGFAAAIALVGGKAFYLPIIGGMFALSVISVIIQVIYYKASGGKRIFRMSPIHHHFQQLGYSEGKIAYAYFIITAVMGAFVLLSIV